MSDEARLLCLNCRFFDQFKARKPEDQPTMQGLCRRKAPAVYAGPEGPGLLNTGTALWPVTSHDDWCGKWRARA